MDLQIPHICKFIDKLNSYKPSDEKLCCAEFTNELGCMQEMKSVQHQIRDVQQQHDQLIEHMKGKQDQLQQLQDTTRQLDTRLEERKLERQKV